MTIADGIRSFVESSENYTIYEGYSGRGMFGKTCLGVIVSHGSSFMDFFMQLTQYLDKQDIDDVDCELEGASYDELGLDTIVYFPSIKK